MNRNFKLFINGENEQFVVDRDFTREMKKFRSRAKMPIANPIDLFFLFCQIDVKNNFGLLELCINITTLIIHE